MPVKAPPIPEGLIDLMKALAKRVLKEKPENINEFAADHFENLLKERDDDLYKGYEKFKHSEKLLKAREKCFLEQIRNQLIKELKTSRVPIHQRSDVQDNQDTDTLSHQPLQQKFRPRKLSSKRPSEILLAIKEEDERNLNAEKTLLQKEDAAKIIQRAFRTYTSRKSAADVKILSENDAAIIIQRTLRKVFSSANGADKVQKKTKSVTIADEVEFNGTSKVNETTDSISDDNSKDDKYCASDVDVKELRNELIHSIADEEAAERTEIKQLEVNSPSGTKTVVFEGNLVDTPTSSTVSPVEGESKGQTKEVLDSLHGRTNSNEVSELDLENLNTRTNKLKKDEKSEHELHRSLENTQDNEDGKKDWINQGTEKAVDNSEVEPIFKIEHPDSRNDGKSSFELQEEHSHSGNVVPRSLHDSSGRSSSVQHTPALESHDLTSAMQGAAVNGLKENISKQSDPQLAEETATQIPDGSSTQNKNQEAESIHLNGMTAESEEIQNAPGDYNEEMKSVDSTDEKQLKGNTSESENIQTSVTNSSDKYINEIESEATPIDISDTEPIKNAEEITTSNLKEQNDSNSNSELHEKNVKKSVWYVGSDPIVTSFTSKADGATQSSDSGTQIQSENQSDQLLEKDIKPVGGDEEDANGKKSNDENNSGFQKSELSIDNSTNTVKEDEEVKIKGNLLDGKTRSVDDFVVSKPDAEKESAPSSIDEAEQIHDELQDIPQNEETVNINNTSGEVVENKIKEEKEESRNSEEDSSKLSKTELEVMKKNAYNNEKSVIQPEIMNTQEEPKEANVELSELVTADKSHNENKLTQNRDASTENDPTPNTGNTFLFISNNGQDISKGSQEQETVKDGEPVETNSEECSYSGHLMTGGNDHNEDITMPSTGTEPTLNLRPSETEDEENFEQKESEYSNKILNSEITPESPKTNGNQGFELLKTTMINALPKEVDLKSNEENNFFNNETNITNYENENDQMNYESVSGTVYNKQEPTSNDDINFPAKVVLLPEVDAELNKDEDNKNSEDHYEKNNNTNETEKDAKEDKKINTSTKHRNSSSNELESEKESTNSEKIKEHIKEQDNSVYDDESTAPSSLQSTIFESPLKDDDGKTENGYNLDETIPSTASLKQEVKESDPNQINISAKLIKKENSKKSQEIEIRNPAKEAEDYQFPLHQAETKDNSHSNLTPNGKNAENSEMTINNKDVQIKKNEERQIESSKDLSANNQQKVQSSKSIKPKHKSQSSLETKSEPNEMLNANKGNTSEIVTDNEKTIKNEDTLTKTIVSSAGTVLKSTTEPHLENTAKKLENTLLKEEHVHSLEGLVLESASKQNESVSENETTSEIPEKEDILKVQTNIESVSSKDPTGNKAQENNISKVTTRSVQHVSNPHSENEDNHSAKDEVQKPIPTLSAQNTTSNTEKEKNTEQPSTTLNQEEPSNFKEEQIREKSSDENVDLSQSNILNDYIAGEKDTFEKSTFQKVATLENNSNQKEEDNFKKENSEKKDLVKVEVMNKQRTDEKMVEDKNMVFSSRENKNDEDASCSVEVTTVDEVAETPMQINNNNINEDTQVNMNSINIDSNNELTGVQNSDASNEDRMSLEESKINTEKNKNSQELISLEKNSKNSSGSLTNSDSNKELDSVDVSSNKSQMDVTNSKDIKTEGDGYEKDSKSSLNEHGTAQEEEETPEDGADDDDKQNNNSAEKTGQPDATNSAIEGTPKMMERQKTVEETCTKKYYPLLTPPLYDKNATNLSEAETMRADSRSTIHDELSEIEHMDISTYEQDSLEAMYYSLRKNEIMLDRMQKTASERKSASQEREPMKNEHNFRQVKSMGELQRKSFTDTANEDALMQEDSKGSPSTESTSSNGTEFDITKFQNPIFVIGNRTKKLLEELHKFNSSPAIFEQRFEFHDDPPVRTKIREYSPRIRMKSRIPTPVKERPKSVSFESPIQMAQKQSEVFLQQLHKLSQPSESLDNILGDDRAAETIRQKMLACSFSEADSDLFEVPEEKSNEVHDDFNISTALETTSTDTDSTIVSAATKIQAGARGFLTRRRLRRASIGEIVPEPNDKDSFGNTALGESLEGLQVSQAAKAQESYKSSLNQKARQSDPVLRTSHVVTSSESKDEYLKDNDFHSGTTALKVDQQLTPTGNEDYDPSSIPPGRDRMESKLPSQTSSDDGHQGINFEGLNLAARRLTLQRGDAMQKDSTHEEDFSGGAHMDSETGKYKPCTSFDKRKPTSSESWRCFGLRQRTMPVQIDSEVLRMLPKHLRKRIKSAELQRSKRDPLQ